MGFDFYQGGVSRYAQGVHMSVREHIRQLTDHEKILAFCDFAFSDVKEGGLPDCELLDLMQVPKLVPNMFIHDYREGIEKGLLIKFSGTRLDEHFGQVIQGKYVQDTYTGDDAKEIYLPLHYKAIERKRPFFARRTVSFEGKFTRDKYSLSTAMYVPCTSNQVDVNYAIGIVLFEPVCDPVETVYTLVGD